MNRRDYRDTLASIDREVARLGSRREDLWLQWDHFPERRPVVAVLVPLLGLLELAARGLRRVMLWTGEPPS